MILKYTAIILVIILGLYIFYKGIREKNIVKIIFPLILLTIKIRNQIKYIISSFLLLLYLGIVGFLPYAIGLIISVILIYLIKRKKIIKYKEFIYVMVIVICGGISVTLAPLWYNFASERPDNTYVEMKEINDNKSLIGLSKEEVVELLGEQYENNDTNIYYYGAGKIINYITGGTRNFYNLEIIFDENQKVKSTSIKLIN